MPRSLRSEIPSFNLFASPMDVTTREKFSRKRGVYVGRAACVVVVLLVAGLLATVAVLAYVAFAGTDDRVDTTRCSRGSGEASCNDITDEELPEATMYPQNVRLPDNVIPRHYNVELTPYIYGSDESQFKFIGVVEIYVLCVVRTYSLTLHVKDLDIINKSIALEAQQDGVQAPKWTSWERDVKRDFFVLNLDSALLPNQTFMLRIAFEGRLPANRLVGLYQLSYKEANKTKWMVATQFQPTYTRSAFPCFDEPAMKATFNVTLVRKPHMTTLSNMPIISQAVRPNSWIADRYATTKIMSTYLLAFVVCDFEYREKTTRNRKTTIRVWARSDAIEQANYALRVGVDILEYYERYFAIEFPLPKLDMIAIPNFGSGAMENWGLVTYRDTAMLYNPDVSSENSKRRVAYVVAHELAHQWFGNLVTLSWWDDLWLNEGFATYVEYIGTDHVHPEWHMLDQFVVSDLHVVLKMDSMPSSHPVRVPVSHPDQISEIFDSISYGKGGAILRMLRNLLGNRTFQTGLTRYLRKFAYKNANYKDLWRTWNEQAERDGVSLDIAQIMDTWILQMGYPVVTVRRNKSKGTAELLQERFLLNSQHESANPKHRSPFNYKWIIPFTYVLSGSTQTYNTTMMNMTDVTLRDLDTHSDWILGNLGQYGYYRVNYDMDNWAALTLQLYTDHTVIPTANRAQILDDAFNLGRAGLIDQLVALRLTGYLKKETEYVPLEAAFSNLGFIESMLHRTSAFGLYQKYILDIIKPLYRKVVWGEIAHMSQLQKFLCVRLIKIACSFGDGDCLGNASALFRNWMLHETVNRIPVDLKSVVYCTAIGLGGEAEWNFAYNQYRKCNVASERSVLLSALACTKVNWILNRYLHMSVNSSQVRSQDFSGVVTGVGRKDLGRYLAWNFVRAKWQQLSSYSGNPFTMRYIISSVTRRFNTEFEYTQLEDFHRKHPDLGAAQNTFQRRKESTRSNIRWMEANERRIHDWLASYVQTHVVER